MRVLIKDLARKEGKGVEMAGRVLNIRSLGEITFILASDYTGEIQTTWAKNSISIPKTGEFVTITGLVRKEERAKGGCEITGEKLEVISKNTAELPIDLSKKELNLQLSTLLDHRTLSLRHPKIQAIFRLYDIVLESYAEAMRKEGFTEIKTPKILEASSEGGGNFFKIKYFERDAYLAQSPQFYKQIMMGVFERVFEIGPVFRAEPHFTTRHVNEYISLDAEMGFIANENDVMAMLTKVIKHIFESLGRKGKKYLEMYGVEIPEVPDKIPAYKLSEIKEKIKDEYGYRVPEDTDIDPEGERLAGRFTKEKHGTDFIFLTHYPRAHRPFYTMPQSKNSEESRGFDLIFKGVEMVTGSQRIHLYDELLQNMEWKKVKPKGMEFYLETFKYAMPPHGGWAIGSERIIQNLLGLESVKEAVLFPRDVKRLSP